MAAGLVAAEDLTVAVGVIDRGRGSKSWIEFSLFSSWFVKFENGEKPYAANEAELR